MQQYDVVLDVSQLYLLVALYHTLDAVAQVTQSIDDDDDLFR